MPEKLLIHPTHPSNRWSQALLRPGPLQHLYNSLCKSSKHFCLVFLLAMTDVIFLSWRRRAMLHIPSNFHTIPGPWIFFFLIRMSKFLPSLLNYDFSLASWSFLTLQRNLPPLSASTCQFRFSFVGYIAFCLMFLEISLWREYTQNPDKPLSSQMSEAVQMVWEPGKIRIQIMVLKHWQTEESVWTSLASPLEWGSQGALPSAIPGACTYKDGNTLPGISWAPASPLLCSPKLLIK